MNNGSPSDIPCLQGGQPHTSRCPPERRSPSPRCPETPRPAQQCPPVSSPGEVNLVKPQLEEMLKMAQFGMREFMEKRFKHMRELCTAINNQKDYLVVQQCIFEELEPVISRDLDTLPDFINMWGTFALYFQEMYNRSADQNNPIPNIDAVNHPSPEICQNTYVELMRSGSTLCLEVERGLRVIEIMYSKLDETIVDAQRKIDDIYKKISASEVTANAMGTDSQDWLRRFRELVHSVQTFLSEWQRGGDQLNQPAVQIPPSPPLLDTSDSDPCNIPRSTPGSSNCPRSTPPSSSMSRSTPGTSMSRSTPGTPMTPNTSSSCRSATPTSAELQQGNERIAALREELQAKETEARGLEQMIQRFNALNSSIHQETQENINQQEILNQSLRAMDDLTPNDSSSS